MNVITDAGRKLLLTATVREAIARAIWNVRREEEDRCDMELEDMGAEHPVWREADAVLAALPAALRGLVVEPAQKAGSDGVPARQDSYARIQCALDDQQPLPIPSGFALLPRLDLLRMRNELRHKAAYFDLIRRTHGLDPLEAPSDVPDTERGLYGKFHVFRVDGKDAPGGPKEGAEYFVLDMVHDPYAAAAVRAYAQACSGTHMELAADLVTILPDR